MELKPLTVFAGASNTGKSYLLTILYAILSAGEDFPHFVAESLMSGANNGDPCKSGFENLRIFVNWMKEITSPPRRNAKNFSTEIPKEICGIFESDVNENKLLSDLINAEIPKFIDPVNCYHEDKKLIRGFKIKNSTESKENSVEVEYVEEIGKYNAKLKNKILRINESQIDLATQVTKKLDSDLEILNAGISRAMKGIEDDKRSSVKTLLQALIEIYYSSAFKGATEKVEFLPASRSTLLAYKHVYSTMGVRELENGGEAQESILDPICAKYLAQIDIRQKQEKNSEAVKKISKKIECEMLEGNVRAIRDDSGRLSYKFMQSGAKGELDLSKASSMIFDLAPLVVYIRNVLAPGDTLIIEEPESHLHPRMQAKIADCIALLVKSGVRVILTTHSELITDRISYLALLSCLGEKGKDFDGYDCALAEDNIGVWGFAKASENFGSTVKKINFENGTYKLDYTTFALEVFNQHGLVDTMIEDLKNSK